MSDPSDKDPFLKTLRAKSQEDLPPGFDSRFWKKFDERFPRRPLFRFFRYWQLAGLSLLFIALLMIWQVSQKPTPRVTVSPNYFLEDMALAQASKEEMDIALHLDLLEVDEKEDEYYPETLDEWTRLLEGDNNG